MKKVIYSTIDGLMSSLTSFMLMAITTRSTSQDSSQSSFLLVSLFALVGFQRSTFGFRALVRLPTGSALHRNLVQIIFFDFVFFFFAVYLVGNLFLGLSLSIIQVLIICTIFSLQDHFRFTFASRSRFRTLLCYDAIPLIAVLTLFSTGVTGAEALKFWTCANLLSLAIGLLNIKSWKVPAIPELRDTSESNLFERIPIEGFVGIIISYLVIYVSHYVDDALGISLIFMCISSYSIVNIFASSSILWIVPYFGKAQKEVFNFRMFFLVFSGMLLVNVCCYLIYNHSVLGVLLYGPNFEYVKSISLYFALSSTFLAFFAFTGHYIKAIGHVKLVNQLKIIQLLISTVLFLSSLYFGSLKAIAFAELITAVIMFFLGALAIRRSRFRIIK